jgi:F5/8 type C domain
MMKRAEHWRLAGARAARERGEFEASLLLYREAADCLMQAWLSSNEPTFDVSRADAALLPEFEKRIASKGLGAPAAFEGCKPLLGETDARAIDRLTASEVRRIAADFDATTRWLEGIVDPPPRTASRRRLFDGVLIGVVLAGGVAMGIAWARSSPNVALHKSVAASSVAFDTTPDGVVDGLIYGQLGFHSTEEESPWVAIDLGARHAIDRVEIFGRSDCCYDQSLPLVAEISDDGVSYRDVGTRNDPLRPFDPWALDLGLAGARFVRVRTPRVAYLVLSEVRVFGHPEKMR